MEGQVGRGFHIDQHSHGKHLFVCGGTGILPFLDTFAYIYRMLIDTYEPEYTLFDDETFIL